ncbi:MAG: DNA-binding protein [Gammaproteobacteria bacterium CG11_big_fil_rev_8_21_14_0_20_46_22]|nr:MAG: DNA-binding protein [Gammaproteobacteria bacterium CG12_big_fil_rev_8_21_14_0_65_46_12]PIR11892.1 MAG: DNA-binding protein [Gammaproteobacteria bacterium CG11_big_fil_rev_8_21_14_0_20_46_22]
MKDYTPNIKIPELLSQKDAAVLLCKQPRWLERRRTEGGGPPFRYIGRTPVYEKAELIEWINSLPTYENTAQTNL